MRTAIGAGAAALVAAGLAGGIFLVFLHHGPGTGASDDSTTARAVTYQILDPGLDRADAVALVQRSDDWQVQAEAEGRSLPQLLAEIHVEEADARAWYESHRDIFGARSFEEVRFDVQKIVQLERLRDRLSPEIERAP